MDSSAGQLVFKAQNAESGRLLEDYDIALATDSVSAARGEHFARSRAEGTQLVFEELESGWVRVLFQLIGFRSVTFDAHVARGRSRTILIVVPVSYLN